jgi:hypothetical protein
MPTAAKKATARGTDPTAVVSHLEDVTDRMHGLLMERADALMGCLEGSAEEAELAMLTDVIEAYERQRWPLGKSPGSKASKAAAFVVLQYVPPTPQPFGAESAGRSRRAQLSLSWSGGKVCSCPIDVQGHLNPNRLSGYSVSVIVRKRMRRVDHKRGKTRKAAKAAGIFRTQHTCWLRHQRSGQGAIELSNPSAPPAQERRHGEWLHP